MKYLPSPRVIVVFSIVLGLGVLAWFWYFSPRLSSGEIYTQQAGIAPANRRDSDSDGLLDWEEILHKTDPKNPDSDRDGIVDGAEEKPGGLVYGTAAGENFLEEPPNFTEVFSEAFARTLGPRILAEGGLKNISQSDLEGVASYLPDAEALLPDPIRLTSADIIISEKNDSLAVKNYFNKLFKIYEKTFFALKEGDDAIIQRAIREGNLQELEQMDPVLAALEQSFNEAKKLAVPRGYEDFALKELGYLHRSKQILEKIRNANRDPLAALILLPRRVELMREIHSFHQETGQLLAARGITYQESEGAYLLFQ